jgi:hypothetical protein
LPEAPVNEIVIDPEKSGYLYVATDFGVYYSTNLGVNWQPAGLGMPILVVNDLRLHNPTRKLMAATYGRGIYTLDLSVLTSDKSAKQTSSAELNCYPNPFSDGVNIEIPNDFAGEEVVVEIIDLNGRVIAKVFEGVISSVSHKLTWNAMGKNGSRAPRGIYVVRLVSENKVLTKRIVLN